MQFPCYCIFTILCSGFVFHFLHICFLLAKVELFSISDVSGPGETYWFIPLLFYILVILPVSFVLGYCYLYLEGEGVELLLVFSICCFFLLLLFLLIELPEGEKFASWNGSHNLLDSITRTSSKQRVALSYLKTVLR